MSERTGKSFTQCRPRQLTITARTALLSGLADGSSSIEAAQTIQEVSERSNDWRRKHYLQSMLCSFRGSMSSSPWTYLTCACQKTGVKDQRVKAWAFIMRAVRTWNANRQHLSLRRSICWDAHLEADGRFRPSHCSRLGYLQ